MDTENEFHPIKLSVKGSLLGSDAGLGGGIAIVAEDANGRYKGIAVPQELASLLEEFLPTSGQRFLDFWATYEAERGGDCFFEDLRRMADAIVAAPDLLALRKLSGAKSDKEFMHNAYQAHVMMLAHQRYPGGVTLLRAGGGTKTPDFVVANGEREIPCEIKTVTRLNGLDLLDDGCRIGDSDRRAFILSTASKIDEAFAQTGPHGLVVLTVWCDSLGIILARTLTDWECTTDNMFVPGCVVLTCRNDRGQDCWFSFPVAEKKERLQELDTRLSRILPPPFSIPLGASAVGVVSSTTWISAGRVVKLANMQTPTAHTDEQLAEYRLARPFRDVPIGRLVLWRVRWALVEQQVEAIQASVQQMKHVRYPPEALLEQPAGKALYFWLACLDAALHAAFEPSESIPAPLASGVLSDDYKLVRKTIHHLGGAFWLAPDVAHVGALVGALVNDRQMFGAVQRVTSSYGKLLREEFAVRQAAANSGGARD